MNTIRLILLTMRPKQWVKNGFVVAPLVFSKNLTDLDLSVKSVAAAFLFSMISGVVYIVNDLCDIEKDKRHEKKRLRPLPAGELTPSAARSAVIVIAPFALLGAFMFSRDFGIIVSIYFLVNMAYSLFLKNISILDVMLIAGGFVLRVIGGAVAIDVQVSAWILVCTFLVALFLALCKRRNELVVLGGDAANHRSVLDGYSIEFLDQAISIAGAVTILSYCLYTMSPEVQHKLGSPYLIMSAPPVIFGIYRYLYLVHLKNLGGSPTRILLEDRPFQLNILIWIGVVIALLY